MCVAYMKVQLATKFVESSWKSVWPGGVKILYKLQDGENDL